MDELGCAPSSTLDCPVTLALFSGWGKVRRTPWNSSSTSFRAQLESWKLWMTMTLLNHVMGGNLEDLHFKLEYQRSARHMQLNSVLGETLKTPPSTTWNWNVNGLLEEEVDCWYFHQLFRQLPFVRRRSRRDVLEGDLGHVDDLSATGKSASKKRRTSTSCSTISGTGTLRDGTSGAMSTICSTVCRCTRSCGLTPARRSSRAPPGSSSNKPRCSSRTHSPALPWGCVVC